MPGNQCTRWVPPSCQSSSFWTFRRWLRPCRRVAGYMAPTLAEQGTCRKRPCCLAQKLVPLRWMLSLTTTRNPEIRLSVAARVLMRERRAKLGNWESGHMCWNGSNDSEGLPIALIAHEQEIRHSSPTGEGYLTSTGVSRSSCKSQKSHRQSSTRPSYLRFQPGHTARGGDPIPYQQRCTGSQVSKGTRLPLV